MASLLISPPLVGLPASGGLVRLRREGMKGRERRLSPPYGRAIHYSDVTTQVVLEPWTLDIGPWTLKGGIYGKYY